MKLHEAQALLAQIQKKRVKGEIYITPLNEEFTLIGIPTPIPQYSGFVDLSDPTQIQLCLTNKCLKDMSKALKEHLKEPEPLRYA